MNDEEARERRGYARLIAAVFTTDELRKRKAEEEQLVGDFRRRARDLHGYAREREVRIFVAEVIELMVRRSPREDPDEVRAFFRRELETSASLRASFDELLEPAPEA